MSEPRYVSPMLDGFSLGQAISEHSGVECYPAMKDDSDKRYIVKKISLPASQVQVEALLLTGAFKNAQAAGAYYEELAQGVREEVRILDELAGQRGFVPYKDHQIEPMESGVGCEVHLLSRYRKSLQRYMRRNPMTHLGAVNLGIDMCAALAVCREAGWLYVDLKPENIYLFGDQEYRIGDLGFVSMDSLAFASLPDRYRSVYTAPEVVDAYSSLNATMDTYALGLVLYQVYNEGKLPFDSEESRKDWLNGLAVGEDLVPPRCADEDMAAIITKACAYDPAERWQTPAELGHALISYMQRNGADDVPIAAPAEPDPEAPAEEITEQSADVADAVEQPVEETAVEEAPAEEPVEDPAVEETPIEEPVEEPAGEETPIEEPVEEVIAEDAPAEEPVEEAVVEETPVETPAEEPAVEESPVEESAEELVVEEAPVEEAAEELAVEEAPVEEAAEEFVVEEAPAEESPAAELPAEEPVEECAVEETPVEAPAEESPVEEAPVEEPAAEDDADSASADWIDLMDAFLAEEDDGSEPEEDEPSLRQLLGDADDLDRDAELTTDDVSAETADILNFAQELIEHEAPAPVTVPEPIDVPIPEPIVIELPEEETADDEATDEEDIPVLELPDEDLPDEPEAVPAAPAEPAPKSGLWKKILGVIAGLAVLAGLAWGAWYYYQNYYLQTIDSMTYEGAGTEITINVTTAMDQSKLTVVCKDTYGNALEKKLENGAVTFSDLVPGSQYIFTLEPDGFNKLVGSTTVTYSTPSETQIIHLAAVTGQEAGSAIISFGVEGLDSTEWNLTYSAEGMEPVNMAFAGHTATVTGLQIGTEYTFTVTAPEGVMLVGENTVKHTASDLVYCKNLSLAGYENGTLTLSWTAPEEVPVDRWIVRCYNANGYDQLQEVTGTTAVFEGITEGESYTAEVIAGGMTLGVRTDITADVNNITGFSASLNGSAIELSWNYAGPVPEGGWKIAWSADGQPSQILVATENKATLSPAAPGTGYSFTIQPPEGTSLAGGTCTLDVPAAGDFSANRLDSSSIIVGMYDVPSGSGWGYYTLQRSSEEDSFSAGSSLALLYTVTRPYSFDSSEFESIFVIRDSDGKFVSASSHTRVWDSMWDNGYCTETVSNLPGTAGEYTLTIYIGGGKLAELSFTIR